MSDLSITAANVLAGTGARVKLYAAGATVTAGKVLYEEGSSGKLKLADADNATAEVRVPKGIALNGASDNQPMVILESGPITIGATLTPGTAYYLSPNAGGICPLADLSAGDDVVLIGIAASTTVLNVDIQVPDVTL